MYHLPYFKTDNEEINKAYRMAIANVVGNIALFQDGILENEAPCILAGLGYNTPWTRDTAINVWNGMGLITPEVAKNTLCSVLGKEEKGYFIDGQYWDKIIWTVGAWNYYLFNGDKDFLRLSYEAVQNTLFRLEQTEFSPEYNLFRGPACYGDGVAAYPDIYADVNSSSILAFGWNKKEMCHPVGVGLPMMALSTNCLYYAAYRIADCMAKELGYKPCYEKKAKALKDAIHLHFWKEELGHFAYLIDPFGGCDSQEGLGSAFAILFGVTNEHQKECIINHQHITPHGIPCVYPSFSRYDTPDGLGHGRHSGTVWPHIQGFWAQAMAKENQVKKFDEELNAQTKNALAHNQFAEIYHPTTGEVYGGRQEDDNIGIREWVSLPHQTWSATAYLGNLLYNLVGLQFSTEGITLCPVGSRLTKTIELNHLIYRNACLDIAITGNGSTVASCKINGVETKPFVPANAKGNITIEIELQ